MLNGRCPAARGQAHRGTNSIVASLRLGERKPRTYLLRRPGRILLGVRVLDCVPQALAADTNSPHANRPLPDLNHPERILEKGLEPAISAQAPRPRKNAAGDDDRPDTDEAMVGCRAGADAENLAVVDFRDNRAREPFGHYATFALCIRGFSSSCSKSYATASPA